MNIRYYFIPLMILISICSCNDMKYKLTVGDNNLMVECILSKVKVRSVSENDKNTFNIKVDKLTSIYGDIELINRTSSDVKYNLKNYYLIYGNKTSSHLYIDSYADYILMDSILKPGEHLKKSVYWVFDGEIKASVLKELKLIVK